MRSNLFKFIVTTSVAAMVLAGCGGGGGSSSSGPGTTNNSTTSRGVIAITNSVVVNGVTFDDSNATITGDDNPSANDLVEGKVVEVSGKLTSATTGVADTIRIEETLRGPVDSVTDATTLMALGQTVMVDASTIIDNSIGSSITALAPGDIIEVHGNAQPGGVIRATYIQFESLMPVIYKVKGFVDTVGVNNTFTIGSLTVTYGLKNGVTTDTSDLPGGVPQVGQFVEVKIPTDELAPNVFASVVELDGVEANEGDEVRVEGVVNSLSAGFFMIDGTSVSYNSSTEFDGGTEADLAEGVKAEAEGHVSGGILVAEKIEFKDSVRIEGDIATVIGDDVTFTGITDADSTISVTISPTLTELISGPINVGDHVRLRARPTSGTTALAIRAEVINPSEKAELQGAVDSVNGTSITILGNTVDLGGLSDNRFRGNDDVSTTGIGQAAFFDAINTALANGTPALVKVSGKLSGTVITWDEASLEN